MSEQEGLDEVVKLFLMESYESLDRLERDLVALAQNPGSRDVLASIFRTIHGLKGTCGFLGFERLEVVTRGGESLLALLRDGRVRLDADHTRALHALVAAIRQMLASIASTGAEGEHDDARLMETFTRLLPVDTLPSPAPSPVVERRRAPAVRTRSRKQAPVAAPDPEPEAKPPARPASPTMSVDVALLDHLTNLAGELVLTRNHLLHMNADHRDPGLATASRRLDMIATELHHGVLKTRRQPIGTLWSRLPRLARDRSLACDRKVRLAFEGRETELDKMLVDAVKETVTQLVRYAVDHGIEPADTRVAAGKAAEGRIVLRAHEEGGRVSIDIRDDGAGIDPGKLRNDALERCLVTPDQATRMDDRAALNLVFLPGFEGSLAAVRTGLERIGGSIEVRSSVGVGTTFTISLPPTLAVIQALVVGSRGEAYVIPQANVVELLRVEAAAVQRQLEPLGRAVYQLRGTPLPLVHLDQALGTGATHAADAAVTIVVLQAGTAQFGLIVERVHDAEEIVVKPLGKQLRGIPVYGGATIRGDGHIALVLDVAGLAQQARLAPRESTGSPGAGDAQRLEERMQDTLLLVAVAKSERVAIPLGHVGRLEEFAANAIERVGGREVVHYDGTILPLLRLSEALGHSTTPRGATYQVVVYTAGRHRVGLVVDRILDIVVAPASAGDRSEYPVLDVDALVRRLDPTWFETTAGAAHA